jgi:hypothetical protein
MNRNIKNIVRGMGSLLDIMPADALNKAVARQHARHDVASHFGRVGTALKDACGRFENAAKITNLKN